jgi:RhtB (resistance to homoserine/threonine) family protein
MPYLSEFLTLAAIHLLAVVSPGPDFAVVSKNSLSGSRRIGIWSAAGVALGILVHVTYCIAGIGWVISNSPLLYTLIRAAGAGYLLYIGWSCLRAAPAAVAGAAPTGSSPAITWGKALRMGFLTNALNPKATLFFLGLFTQVINPSTPIAVELLYGAEMVVATFAWFALLAVALSHPAVVRRVSRIQHGVERAMGVVLGGFGLWMGLSMIL